MISDFRGLIGQELEKGGTIIAVWAEIGTLHLVVREDVGLGRSWLTVEKVPAGCAVALKLSEVVL